MPSIWVRVLALATIVGALSPARAQELPHQDFVFSSNRSGNNEIYLIRAGESEWRNLTNHPGADNWPVWSPDGERIAFQSARDGKLDVWVMNADGSDPTRLTDHPEHDYLPSWAPDGRIVFTSRRTEPGEAEAEPHLYVMYADGSDQRRLVNRTLGGSYGATWTVDGVLVVPMTTVDGTTALYATDLTGTEPRKFGLGLNGTSPSFDADGDRLAYQLQDDAGSKLIVARTDGAEPRHLQPHKWSWNPRWSGDGQWLTYTASADDEWSDLDVHAIPAEGGDPVPLVTGPDREAEGSWRPPGDVARDTEESAMSDVGRLLHKEVTVGAPIEEVWYAWTTEDGLKFISQQSNVRLEVGGPYEWFLDLEPDKQGKRGGEGAVIHAFLPPEMLAFSWTFPPSLPSLRSSGATTQVVVRFREIEGGTHVDFRQFGWQEGEDWERGFDYFDEAWDYVLSRLKEHLEAGAGSLSGESTTRSDIAAEVEGRERAFAATVTSRDLEAFRAFLHPQAVFIGGGREQQGAEEVVAAWSGFFQPGGALLVWEPDHVAVDARGRLAISTGPFRLQPPADANGAPQLGGRYFSVWQRGDDGVWRVLFDAGTEATPLE